MRRTEATLIYRRTKNLRAVQLLLGHSKLESTVRCLGIEVDDALEISEQTEIQGPLTVATPAIALGWPPQGQRWGAWSNSQPQPVAAIRDQELWCSGKPVDEVPRAGEFAV
jgi:hypothetical protein